jgi:hypothetical protein
MTSGRAKAGIHFCILAVSVYLGGYAIARSTDVLYLWRYGMSRLEWIGINGTFGKEKVSGGSGPSENAILVAMRTSLGKPAEFVFKPLCVAEVWIWKQVVRRRPDYFLGSQNCGGFGGYMGPPNVSDVREESGYSFLEHRTR